MKFRKEHKYVRIRLHRRHVLLPESTCQKRYHKRNAEHGQLRRTNTQRTAVHRRSHRINGKIERQISNDIGMHTCLISLLIFYIKSHTYEFNTEIYESLEGFIILQNKSR